MSDYAELRKKSRELGEKYPGLAYQGNAMSLLRFVAGKPRRYELKN